MHVVTTQTRARGIDRLADRRDHPHMDLSDLNSTHATDKPASANPLNAIVGPANPAWQVASQIGAEVACALTPALERVRAMQATGRIDRAGLLALIDQLEQARRASILGQQIAGLAHGGIQQQAEAVNLSSAVRDVIAQRQDEISARGLAVKHALKAVEVVADASLLSALLNALLDWSLRHACTPVDLSLDVKPWPAHARLVCRYGHTAADLVMPPATEGRPTAAKLDNLSWHVVVQLARTMALQVARTDTGSETVLTMEFPHTVNGSLEGAASIEWGGKGSPGVDSPLAGTQVLVIALRREVMNQIRQALLPMGVGVQCVGSVDGARQICRQCLPQAIVYESMVYDAAFDTLRNDIRLQCPELAWVEIVEQGDAFEISSFGGMSMARVGSDAIAQSLPSALMFELAGGL
jgi:hypothetical protein